MTIRSLASMKAQSTFQLSLAPDITKSSDSQLHVTHSGVAGGSSAPTGGCNDSLDASVAEAREWTSHGHLQITANTEQVRGRVHLQSSRSARRRGHWQHHIELCTKAQLHCDRARGGRLRVSIGSVDAIHEASSSSGVVGRQTFMTLHLSAQTGSIKGLRGGLARGQRAHGADAAERMDLDRQESQP